MGQIYPQTQMGKTKPQKLERGWLPTQYMISGSCSFPELTAADSKPSLVRCAGKTKAGKRCKKSVVNNTSFCWQHINNEIKRPLPSNDWGIGYWEGYYRGNIVEDSGFLNDSLYNRRSSFKDKLKQRKGSRVFTLPVYKLKSGGVRYLDKRRRFGSKMIAIASICGAIIIEVVGDFISGWIILLF